MIKQKWYKFSSGRVNKSFFVEVINARVEMSVFTGVKLLISFEVRYLVFR